MTSKSKISRRRFIANSAGVAAGAFAIPYIVPAAAMGKSGSAAPSNRITIGSVGVGGQGTYNLRTFLGMPDVQVLAVCDVDEARSNYYNDFTAGRQPAKQIVEDYYSQQKSAGEYHGCGAYNDFRELLRRDDIDAVVICTPDHWHGLISVAAAKANKDIYCEKPLTNTIAEGKAVVDAVKNYGRILQTGTHERSRDSVRFGCELVRSGKIGKLHTIRVNIPTNESHHDKIRSYADKETPPMPVPEGFDYDFWLGPAPFEPYTEMRCHMWWRFIMNYGGGEITDRGAHIIDIAQLGNNSDNSGPVEIRASGKAPSRGLFNTFMEYNFECVYQNGVRMIGTTDTPRGVKFEGTDGWVFVHIHGGRLEAQPESLLSETIGPDDVQLGRTAGHHENFISSVKSRREPFAPASVGHRTGSICHLLNIAMLTGTELKWDPESEKITNDSRANQMLSRPMRSPWSI